MRNIALSEPSSQHQTLLLFAYILEHPGDWDLVTWSLDRVADAKIALLSRQFGVRLISPEMALSSRYDWAVYHPWGTPKSLVDGVLAKHWGVYADGYSFRFMEQGNQVEKLVTWGAAAEPAQRSRQPVPEHEYVSSRTIRRVWEALLESEPDFQFDFEDSETSLLVADRYWGRGLYRGLQPNAKAMALESLPLPESVQHVTWIPDSRARYAQGQIISQARKSFPDKEVRVVGLKDWRSRFGHLGYVDGLLFSKGVVKSKFFGFDGSAPIAAMIANPHVDVLLTEWMPEKLTSSDAVVLENLQFHRQFARSRVSSGSDVKLLPSHLESASLARAIDFSMRPNEYPDELGTTLARAYLNQSERAGVSLEDWLEQRQIPRKRLRSKRKKLLIKALSVTYRFLEKRPVLLHKIRRMAVRIGLLSRIEKLTATL